MRRSGTSSRSTIICSRPRSSPRLTDDCHTEKLRAAVEAILVGYQRRNAFRHSRRRRWIARRRRTRPAAHLDGRASRWSRDHAAHRQAGGDPGALAECARDRRADSRRAGNRSSKKAARHLRARFWNEHAGYLADVIDCDHQPGDVDLTFRPNQIFAVGGLPLHAAFEEKARARSSMRWRALLTPLGLRSLAPGEPGYAAHYGGGVAQARCSYHQGTVWPWLIGAFVEAWVRVRGNTAAAKAEARARFLPPLYRTSRTRRARPHLGNLRRRTAAHAARLSISSLVVRRTAAARTQRFSDQPDMSDKKTRVLILGGGFGGLYAALAI